MDKGEIGKIGESLKRRGLTRKRANETPSDRVMVKMMGGLKLVKSSTAAADDEADDMGLGSG